MSWQAENDHKRTPALIKRPDGTHLTGLEYRQPLRYFLIPQPDTPAVETLVSFSTSVIKSVATNSSLVYATRRTFVPWFFQFSSLTADITSLASTVCLLSTKAH